MENTFSNFENQEGAAATTETEPAPETPMEGNEFSNENVLPIPNLTESAAMLTSGFSDSNTLVGKISFILLVFFLFMVFMKFGTQFITSLSNPSKVVLVNGMMDGQYTVTIPQDPAVSNSMPLPRSNNLSEGIEFTYSVWLFLETNGSNNTSNSGSQYQHVFSKGSQYQFTHNNAATQKVNSIWESTSSGNNSLIPSPNYMINAPGVYLFNKNSLLIIMNSFSNIYEQITIADLPMNKWINLMIRCEDRTLDAFINGSIIQSIKLTGVPMQNYGDVNIAMNGGFPGYLSNLTYFSYALGTKAIDDLVAFGPNTSASQLNLVKQSYNQLLNTNYLSANWYFSKI